MDIDNINKILESNVILFVGPPLSGKGTQGSLLGKALQRPYLSSGDLFRNEVKSGSELGQQIQKYMDSGELIPNQLTNNFLTNKLSDPIYNNGMVLDGYPRNVSHIEIFDQILRNFDRNIFVVIYLNVPKSILDQRRTQRHRNDDDQIIFERRYSVFENETLPLVHLFKSRNLLINIDSNCESVEQIHQTILDKIYKFEEEKLNYLNSYQWLETKLNFVNDSNKLNILNEFRQRALDQNEKLGRRTGTLRRIVYLRTGNLRKFEEHRRIFEKLYGIEVIQVPTKLLSESDQSNGILLLTEKVKNIVQLALITEKSNLYKPGTNQLSSLQHGVRAINQSILKSISIDKNTNEVIQSEFSHETKGRIDLSKRSVQTIDLSVFGWDDIFIVEANGMSYKELNQAGIKNSSRDMVISHFIKQTIHYKQLINLKFDPPPTAKRAIDFSLDVYDYLSNNKSYNNPIVIQYGFKNLITHVLNSGVFFRSANNRRQTNYWCPGLNGGLPLIPKDDQIHQDTFMAHDIGHFAIPDLIYIGNNSIIHRRAYIASRMISEALTMVIADMLVVDALVKSNVEYDFNKRVIYSLFSDLNVDLSDPNTRIENLKELIKANYRYCLSGDDSLYIKMLREGDQTPSLIEFKNKFSPFFVEDYRWTEHNYENMVSRSEQMSQWWEDIQPLRQLKHADHIQTIDEFIDQIKLKDPECLYGEQNDFIDNIFDIVFENKIKGILNPQSPPLLEEPKRLFKAFTKWITGQLAISSKFNFLSESKKVREDIISYIFNLSDGQMTINDVTNIRSIYENYLNFLAKKNFISHDDQITYAEVYPLFDPFYVNYKKDSSNYEDLSIISKRIYSIQDYRQKQENKLIKYINRPLTINESFYISTIYHLIESGDGQINDGLFVTRPGVFVLSESPINHQLGFVTFLISGISIETSMELISHHESRVARLTSSKTNSMNIPLFRIQGQQINQQKYFIENIIKYHNHFQLTYQPRLNWGEHGNELYNITYPSSKVTTICYTMNLKDFHQLFIGRINQYGNEQEVIHIAQRMQQLLHFKYPQFIQPIQFYFNSKNDQKYKSTILPSNDLQFLNNQSEESITLIGKSQLTKEGDRLLKTLNISVGDDCQRIAEFRSRLTYLAFSKVPSNKDNQNSYLQKITNEYGHLSVLDASQAIFKFPQNINKDHLDSELDLFTIEETKQGILLFTTLKQIRQSILRSTPSNILTSLQTLVQ